MAAKKKTSTSTKTAKPKDTPAEAGQTPAAVTTSTAHPEASGGGIHIPTMSGGGMETPTEAPQRGSLTGSPSWTPPGGRDVAPSAPGVPQSGSPAAAPAGTPKASSPNVEPWFKSTQSPASDEPTQDLTAFREAAASKISNAPEVVLTFDRGAGDARARAERERAVLKPGVALRIRYLREAEDLGSPGGKPVRIEAGYRFDGLAVGMATVADGQRTREGILVRREPVLKVPTEARQELQLWFRIDLEDGRTIWDSLYGHNHRVRVTG